MIQLRNILVATDFSEPSGIALDYGRNLARSYGATLHVMHVVEDVTMRYAGEVAFASADVQLDLEKGAWRQMEALITTDDRRTLKVVPVVETHFGTTQGITQYAATNKIDLIVAGTHGRGMIQHMLMGSVAERLVRTAPCPVLTVRANERDFIAPDAMCAVGAES
jgi:nucleotide-binding universal stress UspA family protein